MQGSAPTPHPCSPHPFSAATDQYGSPSLDDVAAFSRQFNAAYEAAVGEAAAGEIEVEVSSPVRAHGGGSLTWGRGALWGLWHDCFGL